MTDIATLGIKIDASSAGPATTALDKFAAAAKPASASTSALEKAVKDAAKSVVIFDGNIGGTTENVARYRKAVADAAAATSPLDTAAKNASKSTNAIAASGGAAADSLTNLSFQINDIVSGLAMGQSPFTIVAQQGGQVFQVWQQNNNVFKQAASAVTGFLTPMRLLGGVTALAGVAAYVAYGQWKSFALALDDTAKQAGVTSGEMAKLQASASFKGIDNEEFTKGISAFSQQVYLAKQNAGGLLDVFRANGQQVGTFTGSLEKAADLIQRAGSDQQRLVLLQQMGLPANMQWVRYMDQGAEGIRRAKEQAAAFGTAANDEMVQKAREFDDAWNKAWTNFGLGWKNAFVGAGGMLDTLIEKGRKGLIAAGVAVGPNLLKNGLGTALTGVNDDFYKATGATGRKDPNAAVDPNVLKKQISDRQTYLGLLGSTLSAEQAAEQVRLQSDATYRSTGQKVSATKLTFLQQQAREQALGITAIKASTDAQRIESETVGMSIGNATAYAAAQNAINDAKRAGRPLSQDNIAAIQREATALGDAAQRAENMRWSYESLVRGPMKTFQQQLANGATFFDALKASGVSALNAISSKLMDMASQGLWKAAMGGASGGGGFLSTLFGGSAFGAQAAPLSAFPVPLNHTGYGPGDALNNVRYVHPAHFNDAPRFHSGIGPGERAAIIRTDESVLTPGQMKAMGRSGADGGNISVPISINIDAKGADSAELRRTQQQLAQLQKDLPARVISAYKDARSRRMLGS